MVAYTDLAVTLLFRTSYIFPLTHHGTIYKSQDIGNKRCEGKNICCIRKQLRDPQSQDQGRLMR